MSASVSRERPAQPEARHAAGSPPAPTVFRRVIGDGPTPDPEGLGREDLDLLARAIEREIVPRLIRARVAQEAPQSCGGGPAHELDRAGNAGPLPALSEDVLVLADIVLGDEAEAARRYVEAAATRRTLESVCLELLAPTARHLGELWNEDRASFTDVTIGLMRLQHAMHGITAGAGARISAESFRRRRVLLAPSPGDQHSFGLAMVGSFFARAGWVVASQSTGSVADLASLLKREWFGILGISVGSETRLEAVAAALPKLRRASLNAGIGIMVGGPIFVGRPELAAQIGADATADDGMQATWQAENLLATRPVEF